ncbi:MAG TPA: glycosyltransferase family 2 protein [Bacteroidia bacterium]|nr:glycosyltransferase family 2 protein [Bacteroidia bacterium]
MFVSGFTIVRNAVKFDYPVAEAIRSILPLCDEVVVAVGKSEDETLQLIRSIGDPKIRIVETVWNDALREGGRVLADETNKALDAVSEKADWCFYIQGDEVIHEKYHPAIREAMLKWKDDKNVEGLLFDYRHFYGSYDYVGDSRKWYRHEIRVVRNDRNIRSYRDAQGFRKKDNSKLRVKKSGAEVFHYGWVKPPQAQQAKQESFHKMWHDDEWMKKNIPVAEEFDYSQIDSLAKFSGTHPAVMKERTERMNWKFSFDPTKKKWGFKMRLLMWTEKTTGWRPGEYKNYILLK